MNFNVSGITPQNLCNYVSRQLNFHFPTPQPVPAAELEFFMRDALDRTYACFSGIARKKFRTQDDQIVFNPLHPDHYAVFLYLLSNTIARRDSTNPLAFLVYYLNKVMHGLDAYPDIELPEVFQFMHPLGTILGHARYGNYFCVYQGCSVGSDEGGVFPEIGEYVILYAGSGVIGQSTIGNNVVIGAYSLVLNRDIPSNKVVLGGQQRLNIRDNNRHVMERRFR